MNHKFINYSLYNQLINSTVKLLITTKEAREYVKPYKVVVNAYLFALQHKKKPDKFIYRFYCYDYGLYFSPQEVIYLKSNIIDYHDVIIAHLAVNVQQKNLPKLLAINRRRIKVVPEPR